MYVRVVSGESVAEMYSEAMFLLLKRMDVFFVLFKEQASFKYSREKQNTVKTTAVFVFV